MDTLNQYGYSFQIKVLSSLMSDRDFLSQSIDILLPSYFENKGLRWLIEQTIDYFKAYKITPTLDVYKIQISNVKDEVFKAEILSVLKESYKSIQSLDLTKIKETSLEFCRHQEIRRAYEDSLDDFKAKRYDSVAAKIVNAVKKGQLTVDFGLNYLDDIDLRYTLEAEPEKVKTGFPVLDELMNGGLPKGNMGIIIAPSGIGKSWFLSKLGANALKQGKIVLHYTLELRDIYTAKRYDSLLTGIPFDDLSFHVDQVKKTLSKFTGKLFIKHFHPGSLSIHGLESHIEQHKLAGVKPDVVIIDYPELMKIDFTGDRDDKVLGQLYTNLRGMAGIHDYSCWIVDQTNRSASDQDVIGNAGISNSYAKIFIADFVATLSRKPKDKVNNTARLHISKNRLGSDGMTFPCKFDTYQALIEIYNENTESGKKTKEDMVSDAEYELQYAQRQYERFQKRSNNLF